MKINKPTDAKLISRSISSQIVQLREMIESGYGRTGKPLPVKRLKKLKDTLAKLEASQNGLQQCDLTGGQIAHQMEMDDEEDSYWEDEDNFQCCDNCDLPDACCDFGCAIQQGLRKDEGF